MNTITVRAHAKVNLFLRVTGRRPDGYHTLFTLFHRLSLADTITLKKIPSGIRIRTNRRTLPTGRGNLIWKAFEALKRARPFQGGVSVLLKKRIPVAAGLGGGSSDAAAFLLGMHRLYGLGFSKKRLMRLGARLGADVNFFLHDTPQALGRGIGERLSVLPCRRKRWFLIAVMPKPLRTAKVYRRYRRHAGAPLTKENRVARLGIARFESGDVAAVAPFLVNDLSKASVALYPALKKVTRLFDDLNVPAHLISGSGPSVFALFDTEKAARRAARQLKRRRRLYQNLIVCHTA